MRAVTSSQPQNLRQSTLSIKILVFEEDYVVDYETPIFTYHDGCNFPMPRLFSWTFREPHVNTKRAVILRFGFVNLESIWLTSVVGTREKSEFKPR